MTETKKIVLVSSCPEEWGGSEELWFLSIPHFQAKGYEITVFKEAIEREHFRFEALAAAGVRLKDVWTTLPWFIRLLLWLPCNIPLPIIPKWRRRAYFSMRLRAWCLKEIIKKEKPELVIVCQSVNFDGLEYAYTCILNEVPYHIICQKAVENYLPLPESRTHDRKALLGAQKIFFVSDHNRKLTEEQFQIQLPNAAFAFNPNKFRDSALPYPSSEAGFKLLCIGRLFIYEKGQDMLIRILSQAKWRERNLEVTIIGKGSDKEYLERLAQFHKLDKLHFQNYTKDLESTWTAAHGLILPSRFEGMPLVMIEAMSLARLVIVGDAGGTAEVIQHGVNGFIGEAAIHSFETAMEDAWQARHQWEAIGQRARQDILAWSPKVAEVDLVDKILMDIPIATKDEV